MLKLPLMKFNTKVQMNYPKQKSKPSLQSAKKLKLVKNRISINLPPFFTIRPLCALAKRSESPDGCQFVSSKAHIQFFFFFSCFFGHMACLAGSQFPNQGLNPGPGQSPNRWTVREFPKMIFIKSYYPSAPKLPSCVPISL